MMQPYIPQALAAARIAGLHQEAESTRLAREVKRARLRAGRGLAQVHPLRPATPAAHAERAERPAA
jgi:hypothetical protein